MTPFGVVAALAVAASAAQPIVRVELLAKAAPHEAELSRGGRSIWIEARGDSLLVDGAPAPPLALPSGHWTVTLRGTAPRAYDAALAIRAERGTLRFRAAYALEQYVSAVVASETSPGTPREALRAQAVVVRSYALAARGRHRDGALCDLAHCQLLRGSGLPRAHRAAARDAARDTAGEVLTLPSGEVAAATFHAACGGHTASPAEAFGGAGTGAASVPDPGCPPEAWRAAVDGAALAGAIRGALAGSDPAAASAVPDVVRAADLEVRTGEGGWVAQVADVRRRWRLGGDAFARAADAAVGRGVVRSSRFSVGDVGVTVVFRGIGRGHGVGLCQAGAARRAAAGEGHRAILGDYFPDARIARRR